jgi:hypothetical protein
VNLHPFRFGVLGESVRSAADLVDTARRAETAGYATFLMRDHFIEEPFGHQLAKEAATLELSIVTSVVIAGSRREAAEPLAREREWSDVSADRVLEMPSIFIGSVDQIVGEMQSRRERYGISYYVVSDRSMEAVAPIVARLAGG